MKDILCLIIVILLFYCIITFIQSLSLGDRNIEGLESTVPDASILQLASLYNSGKADLVNTVSLPENGTVEGKGNLNIKAGRELNLSGVPVNVKGSQTVDGSLIVKQNLTVTGNLTVNGTISAGSGSNRIILNPATGEVSVMNGTNAIVLNARTPRIRVGPNKVLVEDIPLYSLTTSESGANRVSTFVYQGVKKEDP